MSQEIDMPPLAQPLVPLSWIQTWTRALTRPSVATFEEITRDPKATSRRAYNWIFIAYFVGYGLSLPFQAIADGSSISEIALGLVCALPLGALLAVFFTIIFAFMAHLIAKTLGGTGTFSNLVYAFAASVAPITLIGALVSSIPIVEYLVYPLGLYGIVLNVLAVRAVHQFGWGKAIASNLHTILLAIAVPVALVIGGYLLTNSNALNAQYDEDYATLYDALAQRWNNDDSLPTTSVGFDTNNTNNQFTGVWLVIEMSYTGTCTSTPSDPCNQLTNEFAQIVFDKYRKVNELAGIGVIIGNKPHYLFVESSDIIFQKSLTIEEWRKELSLGK